MTTDTVLGTLLRDAMASAKALRSPLLRDPDYQFNPRHSLNPEVWAPARQPFLDGIAAAAKHDRERNPAYLRNLKVQRALAET